MTKIRWILGLGVLVAVTGAVGASGETDPTTTEGVPDEAEVMNQPLAGPDSRRLSESSPDATYGLRIEQFIESPMVPEGVDPEVAYASRQRRSEALARELPSMLQPGAMLPLPPEERLRHARAAVPVERERIRTRAAAGFPALQMTVDPPDDRLCEPFCDHLARCSRAVGDTAFRTACLATCADSGFGGRSRVENVLALDSCEHL